LYVCVCNAIRESDLRRAACATGGDAEAVYASMGKTPNCGQCLDEANMIVEEERDMARMPVYAE